MRIRSPLAGAVLAAAVLLLPASAQAISVANTTRESVDSAGAQATGGGSFTPSISADGRFVAFESNAANLVASDTNGLTDVFVRDRSAGTTTRVSVDGAGAQASGGSYAPSISADGRFVAFESGAPNLVAGDTNGLRDIFTVAIGDSPTAAADAAPNAAPDAAAPPPDTSPPQFLSARLTNGSFAALRGGAAETPVISRAKQGTTFLYTLSEPARVVFAIEQKTKGRRVGKACKRPSRSNRKGKACVLTTIIGRFAKASAAGSNSKPFSGRIGSRALKPGAYTATLTAKDPAGNASAPKRLSFRVVRG